MTPVQITIRDMPPSPVLETTIRKKAEKLSQYYDRTCSCRVVIELPQKHKHQGKLYNVRVEVFVPGKELVSTRKCDQDIYIALRDAFKAIFRQLKNTRVNDTAESNHTTIFYMDLFHALFHLKDMALL